MDTKTRRQTGKRRGQKPKAPSRTDLAEVVRETARLWRKHHLSYDQSKYVVEQVRRRIGLTGQYASVDEDLTGTQNLVMIGQLLNLSTRQAKARAAELLAWFDLTAAANKMAKTYSGGMRRRLDLAASLADALGLSLGELLDGAVGGVLEGGSVSGGLREDGMDAIGLFSD